MAALTYKDISEKTNELGDSDASRFILKKHYGINENSHKDLFKITLEKMKKKIWAINFELSARKSKLETMLRKGCYTLKSLDAQKKKILSYETKMFSFNVPTIPETPHAFELPPETHPTLSGDQANSIEVFEPPIIFNPPTLSEVAYKIIKAEMERCRLNDRTISTQNLKITMLESKLKESQAEASKVKTQKEKIQAKLTKNVSMPKERQSVN